MNETNLDENFEDVLGKRCRGPKKVSVTIPEATYLAIQELVKVTGKTQRQLLLEAIYMRLALSVQSEISLVEDQT